MELYNEHDGTEQLGLWFIVILAQCSNRKWKRTGTSRARDRGAEDAERGWAWGMLLPENFFFRFLSGNGVFWCILGVCFNE